MNRLHRVSRSLVASGCLVSAAAAAAATTVVQIEQMRFDPPIVVVHRGDTVVWVNRDLVAHAVNTEAGGVDSGSIAPEASWRYVATRPGRYPYKCMFHPTMHGTLVVEPSP